MFHAEAALPGRLISFMPLIFTQPADMPHAIKANGCTYIELTTKRDVDRSCALYGYGPSLDLAGTTWPPFPPQGRIS